MYPRIYDIFDRLKSSLDIHGQDLAHLRTIARALKLPAAPPTLALAADHRGLTARVEGDVLNVHQAGWLRPILEGPHDHGCLDNRWSVAVRQASTGFDPGWLQGIKAATATAALRALARCQGSLERGPFLLRSLNTLHDLDGLIIHLACRELRTPAGTGGRQSGHVRPVHTPGGAAWMLHRQSSARPAPTAPARALRHAPSRRGEPHLVKRP